MLAEAEDGESKLSSSAGSKKMRHRDSHRMETAYRCAMELKLLEGNGFAPSRLLRERIGAARAHRSAEG